MGKKRRKLPILKIEGIVLVIASMTAYSQFNLPFWWAGLIVFLPDLLFPKRFLEYRKIEIIYDLLHTYPLPSLSLFICVVTDFQFEKSSTAFVILWFTHIGFDRLIGRGAKYDGVFVNRQLALARQLLGQPPLEGDADFVNAEPEKRLPSKWGD